MSEPRKHRSQRRYVPYRQYVAALDYRSVGGTDAVRIKKPKPKRAR